MSDFHPSSFSSELTEEQEDLLDFLSDCPVADNHGSKRASMKGQTDPSPHQHPLQSLETSIIEAVHGLGDGFQSIVDGEECYHGMTAHRGILSEDEFECLDMDSVRAQMAVRLGSTEWEMEQLYGLPGRLSQEHCSRRGELDEELLALRDQGVKMTQVARFLGWQVENTPTGSRCRKMTKALQRADTSRRLGIAGASEA